MAPCVWEFPGTEEASLEAMARAQEAEISKKDCKTNKGNTDWIKNTLDAVY
jgi:hypothetical protein